MTCRISLALLLLAPLAIPHGAIFPPPQPDPRSPPPPPAIPPGTPWTGPADGPSGPRTGGASTPTPSGPSTGGSGGWNPGSVPTGGRSPAAGIPTGAQPGLEPTSWELWWRFNRDAYLDLKAKVESIAPSTPGDDGPTADERIAFGVTAAMQALPRERQRDLVSSLLVAVARACDDAAYELGPEFVRALAPFVADPDQEIGETAAASLGILRHHAAIDDLASLLHDDEAGRALARGRVSMRTRAFAAYALGLAAARADREEMRAFAAHHLQRGLESSADASTPELAAACVLALGLVPMPEESATSTEICDVPSLRSREERPPRTRASQAALLTRYLRDRDRPELARAHVPDALARLGIDAGPELRAEIARELASVVDRGSNHEVAVVRGAVLALGRLGDADDDAADARTRHALRRMVDAPDFQARLFAYVSLAQVASRPGDSDDPSAAQADARDVLLDRLVRGRARERSWAAIALGVLEHGRARSGLAGSPAVRAALRRALGEASAADQIGAIAIGIGLCADRDAAKDLLRALDDVRDPTARGHVATALGLVGDPRARPPLRTILSASRFQPELLRETAIALALLGDVDLESTLLEELRVARSTASQAGIARAIGFAGSVATIQPLVKMLRDTTTSAGARAFSAVALGMVCDRERMPWNSYLSIGVNYPSAPSTLSDGSAGLLDIL